MVSPRRGSREPRAIPGADLTPMPSNRCFAVICSLLVTVLCSTTVHAQALDRAPDDLEVRYAPEDGEVSAVNPAAFVWLPVESVPSYIVQFSTSPSFESAHTTTVRDVDMTVYVPDHILAPGSWYWRYGYELDGRDVLSRTRGFTIAADAVEFPFVPAEVVLERIPRERPRIYFTPQQVDEIRSDRSGRYAELVDPVVEEAELILRMNEPLFPEPRPWEEYEDEKRAYVETFRAMRPYTQRMVTSALAYLYTGDPRFAAEARRRLMHFMTWDVNGPSSAIWPTELGMDIAENAPRTFDWIHGTLSEEDRRICTEVLAARIGQINRDVHRSRRMESRPYSSHPGRMIGFVVEGAIVLAHDVPEVADWLDYTLRILWSIYPAWGGADGGWHEGVSYWGSYMRRMVRIVAELDRLGIPLKDKPFFRNTGYFGLYAGYPDRPTRAFGDAHHQPVGPAHGNVTYAFSTLYRDPYLRWHAERAGGGPSGPAAINMYDPSLEPRSPDELPQSRVFESVGWAVLHSRMSRPEDNVLMILKSSPFGAISHNHASQNAFVLEAFGEPLVISSGYRSTHGIPHHTEWMWHTKAHASILVDGEGQVIRERGSRGRILDHRERGAFAYTAGDATEAYGGRLTRFHRHVLFSRPDYFVIVDDLKTAGKASTYQWLLHAVDEMEIDEARQRVGIAAGEARLAVRFLTPQALSFTQRTGFDPPTEDPIAYPDQYHLTVSTAEPETAQRFVTVLWPYREGQAVDEQAELIAAEGGLAVRVGDDLVLWKDPDAPAVRVADVVSTEPMEVRAGHFR